MKEREIKVNELLEHLLEDIVDGSKLSSIKFWFEDEYRLFNEQGITKAMILAITKDRVDIVKFLIDQKIGFDERSVVEAVHKHKNMDIIQLLKENGISNFDKEPTLGFVTKKPTLEFRVLSQNF